MGKEIQVTSEKHFSFLAAVLVVSSWLSVSAGAQQQDLQALRNSDFVFVGTVQQTGQRRRAAAVHAEHEQRGRSGERASIATRR